MSQHEKQSLPLPPQELSIPQTEHISGYQPFGQEAVRQDEHRLGAEMRADWYDQAADFNLQMAYQESQVQPTHGLRPGLRHIAQVAINDYRGGNHSYNRLNNAATADMISADQIYEQSVKFGKEQGLALAQVRSNLQEIETLERDTEQDGVTLVNEKRRALNDYLEQAPDIFQNSYDRAVITAYFNKQKTIPDRVEWLANTSDKTLQNFLQWHNNHTLEYSRDPEVVAQIEQDKAGLKASLVADVQSGKLPEVALAAVGRIDRVRVTVGDIFDTTLTSRLGYHHYGSSRVVVGRGYDKETFRHEMYHAALGRFNIMFMNEAMDEHLTLAGENGDYLTVRPDLRDDGGSYQVHREAMASTLDSGLDPDLLEPAIAAFIEGDQDDLKSKEFHDRLNASYGGVDVFEFLEEQFNAGFHRAQKNEPHAHYYQQMDSAARYVTAAVSILGSLARGYTRHELADMWSEQIAEDPSLKRHLNQVSHWVDVKRRQAVAA